MTDIFHEIQEDLRRERMRKLWDRYGIVVIAAIILVLVGAAGWSGYRYWRQQQAMTASAAFHAAIIQNDAGKHDEAEAAFQELAKTGPKGYRGLALFRAANAAEAKDKAAGVAAFDAIAADGALDPLMRDMARVRAALILLDTSDLKAVEQRVADLASGTGPLRNPAREILALAQMKAGQRDAAYKTATEISTDAGATAGLRSRAELLRRLTAPPAAEQAAAAPEAAKAAAPDEVAPTAAASAETPTTPAPTTPAPAAPAPAAPAAPATAAETPAAPAAQ